MDRSCSPAPPITGILSPAVSKTVDSISNLSEWDNLYTSAAMAGTNIPATPALNASFTLFLNAAWSMVSSLVKGVLSTLTIPFNGKSFFWANISLLFNKPDIGYP